MDTFIRDEKFKSLLLKNGLNSADSLWNLKGEDAKRKTKARHIQKIIFPTSDGDEEFYLKKYAPIPLSEIIKNKISLKPVFTDGALHEFKAIKSFETISINVPKAIAVAKFADGRSCILTLAIKNYIRASDLLCDTTLEDDRRKKIITEIARIAARMHSANFAHQDLYLLHFFVVPSQDDQIYLIDLQRAILSERTLSSRWIVKDLAQLLFSAKNILPEKDFLVFKKEYCKYVPEYKLKALCPRIFSKAERMLKRVEKKLLLAKTKH